MRCFLCQDESGDKDLVKVGATIYKLDDNYMSFERKAFEKVAEGYVDLLLADSMND